MRLMEYIYQPRNPLNQNVINPERRLIDASSRHESDFYFGPLDELYQDV